MTPHAKRALVIAHEPDGPACQIETRLLERGFEVHTHVVTRQYDQANQATPWPNFDDYELIVPMGSVRSLTNKAEISSWVYAEIELLRVTHEKGTPILGVCFGGQLLAEALGGTVEKAPVTEIGWFEIRAPEGATNPVGPGPWKEWHHDRFTPPPSAELLAENDNAAQLFRLGRTVGTQFHPEVDTAHISSWLSTCDDEYLHGSGVDRETIHSEMVENEARNIEQCHALVDWYLDHVAFTAADLPVADRATA